MGSSRGSYEKPSRSRFSRDTHLDSIIAGEVLSREEERELFASARAGDAAARHCLIMSQFGQVVTFAGKYSDKGLEYPDLIQEGMIGLIRAVDKFDPSHGHRLSTYAHAWIQQPIRRALQNRAKRLKRLELMAKLPTPELLRGEDLDPVDPSSESLSSHQLDADERRVILDGLLSRLSPAEQEVLRLRYALDGLPESGFSLSLREIGKLRGVTYQRVGFIIDKALSRLQAIAKAGGRRVDLDPGSER
jgi:RNA polymerase sigma factor (sigma-70 family)